MRATTLSLGLLGSWVVFVLFFQLGSMSLELYDEARRAVSAAEMLRGEASWLVPSYSGAPDHWGTKPPLLIWCQAFWMSLTGLNEWAVRLPSALAGLSLCGLLIWWGKRTWGSPLVGMLAAVSMLCCWELMGNHGLRTGDFDALLMLFLTVQVVCFEQWIASQRDRWLALAAGAVWLAGMTKGIAGGFFLPGIGLWLLATTRGRAALRRPRLYLFIGTAIGGVLLYYGYRNMLDPGYLSLVSRNELGGRFVAVSEGHRGSWWFYGKHLLNDPTYRFVVPLLLPALGYYALVRTPGNESRPALLLSITAVTFLLVISTAATKIYWYKNPVLPLFGMLIGGFLWSTGQRLHRSFRAQRMAAVIPLFYLALFFQPGLQITQRVLHPAQHQETPATIIGQREMMRLPAASAPYTVLVRSYHPHARFYVMQQQAQGKDVQLAYTEALPHPVIAPNARPPGGLRVGERVIVCRAETRAYLTARFVLDLEMDDGHCQLVTLRERGPGG